MKIKQFDRVLLIDGREGSVTDVLGKDDLYYIDVCSPDGNWDNITVKHDQIEKVLS